MLKNSNLNKESSNTHLIALERVNKTYPISHVAVLRDVSLTVAAEEFVCIIGPSGCGKSTLLKIITGLEQPSSGNIVVPKNIAMVFQSGALLPWLSVEDNVAFGLRATKKPEKEIVKTVEKFLDMVDLSDFAKKYPHELSGGQRQRVGIARALAVEPSVLLLDEPFSALDPKTTEALHKDILKIWKETHITIVMVSHLIEEAVSLGDRVVLMKDGKIEEIFTIPLPYPRREQALPFHELVQKVRATFFA